MTLCTVTAAFYGCCENYTQTGPNIPQKGGSLAIFNPHAQP